VNLEFHNKKISGILLVLPDIEKKFTDEMKNFNFTEAQSLKLKLVMGYDKHRIVSEKTATSDLSVFGMKYLLDNGLLNKDETDGLILITQSPDFFMPPTSNVIQGRLNLKLDMICLDINQGCCGYLIGLMQAFMLLEQESINKVVLINADVLSKKVSKRDRNSYPLVGDAASITIVEKSDVPNTIYANLKMDGSRGDALLIPAGGFRLPSSQETSVMEEDQSGNFRSKDNLVMKGDAIFNFVQVEVPPMINALLEFAGTPIESIDYFMFHQPNRFMLQKLADKMKVSYNKMPNNIVENFGNSSGVTIPTTIAFNLGGKLEQNHYKMCLAGFGSGLTWSSMLMDIGYLKFCKTIEYKDEV
jgi:3-oxoacyl-[acyl-carrier-protein] synthase-3